MSDKEKKDEYDLNYVKGYVSEGGYTLDATNIRKKLAGEAYERYTEQEKKELQQYAEEQYIAAIYPNEMDEYLVEGAILTCTMATTDQKIYRNKKYDVIFPSKNTFLTVTENKDASCYGDLHYATVKDEWEALEADETCLEEGTCKALMNLNEEWDNLPRADGDDQKINGIPTINMGSILFCRHGGIIIATESGQRMHKVINSIHGIAYENGEIWSEEQIEMAKYVTYRMLLEGYSLDIIAGVVGNIVNEGDFGYFESSYYKTNPDDKPLYLIHMDEVHNYRTYVSGKGLYEVGTNILVRFRKEGNCTNELHMFGLGMAQWTGERGEHLIDRYLEKFGDNAFPTKEECRETEIEYMLEELRTTQHNVIVTCREETDELSHLQAAEKNAEIFMNDYEKPKDDDSSKRKEAARIWYDILEGEKDKK